MLKSRDITLPIKVCLVKAMVFPVVMYGCGSWTIKKAKYRRIDAFELWCWRRLLRVPRIARRSNQSILKEISPEYSLEGLMLKLKLQNFCHLMRRTDSLEKTLMLGKIEGDDRGWDGWMASLTWWTWVWAGSRCWWWTGRPGVLQSMGSQTAGHDWVTELKWTLTSILSSSIIALYPCISLYCYIWDKSLFVFSYRIPDLKFDLFSINVDHTGPKLHACQRKQRERMLVSWTTMVTKGSCLSSLC